MVFAILFTPSNGSGMEFERKALDTLYFARKLHPELESRSLPALCAHYGIVPEKSHRAVEDAISAHRLYGALVAKFPDYDGFVPRSLTYTPKKQEPMTWKQKRYLCDLLHQHGMEYKPEMDCLSKSDASRLIDKIIFSKGKPPIEIFCENLNKTLVSSKKM